MKAKTAKPILATRIKAARQVAGLTQTELGKLTGLEQTFISRLERGGAVGKGDHIKAIAKALNTSSSYLLGEDATDDEDIRMAPGLAALTKDERLMKGLQITRDEIAMLTACRVLGGINKDGYVQLLLLLRSLTKETVGVTRS